MLKPIKLLMTSFMMLFISVSNAAATPANFSDALPTSLIPDGFWTLAGLAISLVIAVAGVVIAIKMVRRAS